MPVVELTDVELNDACMAARMAARQAHKDATAQPNPRIATTFAADAARYTALAASFEQARTQESHSSAI
jgi:hypothetical protein